MKRSEINTLMRNALDFFADNKFYLPTWATYSPADWKGKSDTMSEIVNNAMPGTQKVFLIHTD